MIEAKGIGKRFGARWVLRGVTLSVSPGETVGLMGANGSGKSTVLRVLATLLKPNAGTATVDGHDVVSRANDVRSSTGYLAHAPGLYDDLTARENLLFAADMLGVAHAEVVPCLDRVGLARVANDRVRGFSAGMQRRLALARLILRRPSVLLLDEPYSNLDADGIDVMNALLSSVVAGGGSVLVALHELAPSRGLIDRVLTLEEGRIAAAQVPRDSHLALSLNQ
jgi:heme exporter protein A